MDDSTTRKRSRAEQCQWNAQERSARKRQQALAAVAALQAEGKPLTKAAVARRAGVSVVFLRKHDDVRQAIAEAEACGVSVRPVEPAGEQVIAALRRRLTDLQAQLARKDAELRAKQHELDRLYGKLASRLASNDG